MRALAVAVAVLAMAVLSMADVHAEAGYASPQFVLSGPVSLNCIDTSTQPNYYNRTADSFACVGPAGTTAVSGTLYQVIYVRYARYYSWGWVTWHCAPIAGPYDRYAGRFTNLACHV